MLKFFVTEKELRATVKETNGAVWEDSCVEFFVSFDDQGYYNIECNCMGTIHAAFGKNRMERTLLTSQQIQKIHAQTELQQDAGPAVHWQLTLVLPLELFAHHNIPAWKGLQCRANFYKCGDRLREPHFISWTNIDTAEPDFHVPQFFGTLQFE